MSMFLNFSFLLNHIHCVYYTCLSKKKKKLNIWLLFEGEYRTMYATQNTVRATTSVVLPFVAHVTLFIC